MKNKFSLIKLKALEIKKLKAYYKNYVHICYISDECHSGNRCKFDEKFSI